MNDRAVSLFEKYGITPEKTRKGRGSIIVQTQAGQLMLTEYSGPTQQLQMEYELLKALGDIYDRPLDKIHKTLEDDAFYCVDYEGKKYILKDYVEGREMGVCDPLDVRRAADGLARLHLALRRVRFPAKDALCRQADKLIDDFERRSAELLRARNYMRKLPRRDDFELAFLENYDLFWEQTLLVRRFLDEDCLQRLEQQQLKEQMLVHGDCNQHNILVQADGVAIINFERAGAHLQVKDLYLFMRKILEKNDWSFEVGENILSAYQTVLPLTREERIYLYTRFLYPEKFWKVANGYLNRRKALPARRQQEKLLAALEKEEKRQLFLARWVELCR